MRWTVTFRPSFRVLHCKITAWVLDDKDAGGTFLVDVTLATFAPPPTKKKDEKF